MSLVQILIGVPFFSAFALLGRWLQLHPEKVVLQGHFTGQNTFWAKLFRAQIAFIGTFAVFGGTWIATSVLLSIFMWMFNSFVLGWIAQLMGMCCGIYAAIYVRKEVKKRPAYISSNPYGWWP